MTAHASRCPIRSDARLFCPQEYPYGEKELKKSVTVAGLEVPSFGIDPRITVGAAILGLLSFLPISIIGLVAATPGTQSPFNFLDRWYPPAVQAKAAKAAKKAAVPVKAKDAAIFPPAASSSPRVEA